VIKVGLLRTGLADRDYVHHMVAAARALHPERTDALDTPALDIGRRWCRLTPIRIVPHAHWCVRVRASSSVQIGQRAGRMGP
jgi:hypothetical protein